MSRRRERLGEGADESVLPMGTAKAFGKQLSRELKARGLHLSRKFYKNANGPASEHGYRKKI